MKKTLIALAVLGAAGVAQAQSSVTIYGQVQPSLDYMSVKNAAGTYSRKDTAMADNASRLGFKGQEDLGNGLKAIFQLEAYYEVANKSGFNASRDAFVGLSGNTWGTVTFGSRDSVYKRITASYDPFADSIGDYNSIMSMAPSAGADKANQRYKQSFDYFSPVFNGFQAQATYALGGQYQTNSITGATVTDKSAWDLGVSYNNGPLELLAAYDKQTMNNGVNPSLSFWKVGGAYNFGQGTTVRGIYERVSQTGVYHTTHYLLGVQHDIGNVNLLANYIHAGNNLSVANTGATAYNLGVQYNFSKRTNILAQYAYLKDNAAGVYTSDAGYTSGGAGDKVTGISARIQHKF